MDPADVLREFMLAKEEHERALAAVGAMRQQLETARTEYADAQQTELQTEQDLQRATATVAIELQQMHLGERDASASDDAAIAATAAGDRAHAAAGEGECERAPVLPAIAESLVEYHRNIGCYHCYLFLEGGKYDQLDAAQLQIQVAFPVVKLLLKTMSDAHGDGSAVDAEKSGDTGMLLWSTEIERNVDQTKCVIDIKPDHMYLRLPVKAGDKDVAGDGFSSFSQITSQELDKRHYSRIVCRACDSVLVRETAESPIEKVLPLPSANWMDMFDFWGAGLGAFEHLPREDIFAQAARVYVGEAHILLHESNTMAKALESAPVSSGSAGATVQGSKEDGDEEEESTGSFWQPLQCSTCAAALGMRHRENPATIRLNKHVIASRAAPAGAGGVRAQVATDVFARYTVDSAVCAKLLELADSDGVFRFTLRSPERVALHLQLLSWETLLKRQSSPLEFRRVLKVLYTSPSTPTVASLPGAVAAQDLVFAPAICDAVVARLQASSALLPASLRTFNKMDVGYLFA